MQVQRNSLLVVVILMYPDKTYTRKVSISILKYSTLYTRPTLHCSIHSVKPLTYKDGLSIEGCRILFFISNTWIFCSNKALYSASLSFTIYWTSGRSSTRPTKQSLSILPFLRCFLGIGSLVFSKFLAWC